MNPLSILLHSFLLALVSLCITYVYSWAKYRKYKFPPSPPGRLPLIGHAHLLPKSFPGDKAKEWGISLEKRF
jgi:hypothetical protein